MCSGVYFEATEGVSIPEPCSFQQKKKKVLAYLSVSGLLPESFPHARWVAVQRSFCTQEAAVCTCGAEWEEVRRILELVSTANVTLESSHGTTLWTRNSVCLPEPQDDEFLLRLLVHPETGNQSHLYLMYCMSRLLAWETVILAILREVGYLSAQ